jgi:hypothetical protein
VTETSAPHWGADPSIAWRILLTSVLTAPPALDVLAERQRALHRAQGWPTPPEVAIGDLSSLRRDLAEVRDVPLVLGLSGSHLVVSAFHAYVDGLGLLEVLAALTDQEVLSSARGLGDRPAEVTGPAARLREVFLAPPAPVATPSLSSLGTGDAYAEAVVPIRVRTSDLVHAGAQAVLAHNREAGRRSRHVTVAVGAGRPAPDGEPLRNRSELLRLRDVDLLSGAEVAEALRTAPLSAAGGSGVGGGRLSALALRALAPRLGSTLLVSHLGDVTASAVSELAFHPVTAGGSGLSLGAVGLGGRTVLTLRARAAAWDEPGLSGLLARIVAGLS